MDDFTKELEEMNDTSGQEAMSTEEQLKEAYKADTERKSYKEEELIAAREYLNLLLHEVEGRNEEIVDELKKKSELQERLSKTESEVEALKSSTKAISGQRGITALWACLAVFELVILLGVAIISFLGDSSAIKAFFHSDKTEATAQAYKEQENANDRSALAETLTAKYCDDLAERIKYLGHEAVTPFEISIETIDGLEYLVFTNGKLKVCYKNEYYLNDMTYRKCVIIENPTSRFMFSKGYDMENDLAELCPDITVISGSKYLVFTEYSGAVQKGIPANIRLIDCESFAMYLCTNLRSKLLGLMETGFIQEKSPIEGYPMLYRLKTSRAEYKYAITEAAYSDIQYNQYLTLDIESLFNLSVGHNSIEFTTEVILGDGLFLGNLCGSLIPTTNGITISGAKFGAYAQSNVEDPGRESVIIASNALPEEYIAVAGFNKERFYIPVKEELKKHEYYWENMNTDDSNNWLYYDADGNAASIRGIDVSKYQQVIDWEQVAQAGVKFAIIRMGYRGMNEGTLETDPYFKVNAQTAASYGINVGVYFFSQALNEEEAVQEAEFVLNAIKDYRITYPVVFDTEYVSTYNARANSLSESERTKAAIAFLERIKQAGYTPMLYANTKYMVMGLDQEKLEGYDKWYAYYSTDIPLPYDFQMLQYSESGSIPGISEPVDLDISFVDYAKE